MNYNDTIMMLMNSINRASIFALGESDIENQYIIKFFNCNNIYDTTKSNSIAHHIIWEQYDLFAINHP